MKKFSGNELEIFHGADGGTWTRTSLAHHHLKVERIDKKFDSLGDLY